MLHLALRNCFHRCTVMTFNRGYKFHAKGIIPGGGLKLQGTKEEEYFSRQDHKVFKQMKQHSGESDTKEIPKLRRYESTYSVKHKNILEEAYFLNENCNNVELLKAKLKHTKKEY